MTGIPDPGAPSGTFAALERTSPIVQVADGIATTTSMRVANGTDNDHASVLRLVRDNLDDFEEFGMVGFEIRPRPAGQHGGGDIQIAILNEEHATLLLTYMRNNAIVKDFKKRLVHAFAELRRAVAPQSEDEIVHQALAITARRVEALTARVAVLEPKAEFYDELMEADGTYSFLAVAKMLGWGRNILMRELRRAGVLQGNNLPYRRYEHHFKVVPQTFTNRKTGETVPTATTTVRPSGIDFLRKKLDRSLVVTS